MNILFLRGAVPPKKEHPEKLYYDKIENCEDVWTQLFYYLAQRLDAKAELLYQGGDRKFVVDRTFTERWVPSFKNFRSSFDPDLIVCRGGFSYYDHIITKYRRAKKVYYGAGVRFFPSQKAFNKYDLFLVDSPKQKSNAVFRGRRVKLFIKPAALLFKPVDVPKKYDVCFVANASQAKIKRHKLLLKAFAGTNYKILSLGNTSPKLIQMAKDLKIDITWGGWSLRKSLPKKINKCKVGVCCSTNYDSCPRVIPEYLACGIPVVATKNMNFWHDKYIVEQTGALVDEDKIKRGIDRILDLDLNPANYYRNNLSMKCAAKYLAQLAVRL